MIPRIASVILLISFMPMSASAQKRQQALIDSLHAVLPSAAEDTNKAAMLNMLSYNYPYINPDEGLKYGMQGLELAEKLSWTRGIAAACYAIGGNYANKADYALALEYEYRALKIYEELNDRPKQALLLQNIGIVHHTSKNQQKALEYDERSLRIYEELNNKLEIAALYGNMANVYYSLRQKDKVLEYNLKSLNLYRELNDHAGTARLLGNIANFYAIEGEFSKAMVFYFDALRKETALGNKNGVTRNMGNIGETYLDIAKDPEIVKADSLIPPGKTANLQKALYYLKATVDNARELGQTEYILAFAEVLSDAYRLSGNSNEALHTYKDYISVRDSVYDVEKYTAAARREMDYEYGKREDSIAYQKKLTEVKLDDEKKSRNKDKFFYTCGIALVLVFSAFMFNRWRITQKQKRIIEKEKQRSDDLLLNILPVEVAEELKEKGAAEAKHFDDVTVMFTDFKDFTLLSEKLTPSALVAEIDACFKAFDRIISRHNIEKIKTIGDSYMCAGGLPVPNKTNAEDIVKAALEIQEYMNGSGANGNYHAGLFKGAVRIGIHTGPVVAGIVGIKKFAYDIWGDTVNIASRKESGGEAGKVNISGATYQLVKDKFSCIHRGKINAKNKGEIDMYFVE